MTSHEYTCRERTNFRSPHSWFRACAQPSSELSWAHGPVWSFSGFWGKRAGTNVLSHPACDHGLFRELLSLIPLPGGRTLWPWAASFQKCPGGKRFSFQAAALNLPMVPWLCSAMGLYTSLTCWLGREAGWTHRGLSHGHLSNTCPPPFNPLVIDCPASCVCLHCLGVQLDRAPFWQVPQPGTAALDVQRTVHICQVCVCSRHPRREESSGKPRVFAVPRASGR